MTKPYYITTPIYYVNDSPHLGHAYTTIACDVMARFMRLDGRDVKFLTGTDEHGQKVDKAAAAAGIDPQSFTDDVSARFRRLVCSPGDDIGENVLDSTNDDFIRTTEPRHKKAAQELWNRIEANGHIYLDTYEGWYSVRDEAYYQESELVEKDGEKVAPTGAPVEWVKEESYFFKLSEFQDKLLEFYDNNPEFVIPNSRLNEVKRFVEGGLKDLSISRTTFNWGVPVPGDDKHVMYVWIDALCNYLTSAGFPDMDSESYKKYWEEADVVHVVGKDILRFHAVYWPAFLMAADIPCPDKIVAHGWWTVEGEKMSKSLGNVLSPDDMVEKAGGIDQLRYFMLRAMPFGNDGDFSEQRLVEIINADLANNVGNLGQRTLKMIQKNCEGKVPESDLDIYKEIPIMASLLQNAEKGMGTFSYSNIIEAVMTAALHANTYITEKEPWKLAKEDTAAMASVLYVLAEAIRHIAISLQPFCPNKAKALLDQLAVPEDQRTFTHLTAEFALKPGTELPEPEGIFPRLEFKEAA